MTTALIAYLLGVVSGMLYAAVIIIQARGGFRKFWADVKQGFREGRKP